MNFATMQNPESAGAVLETTEGADVDKQLYGLVEPPSDADRLCREVLYKCDLGPVMCDVLFSCFPVNKLLLLEL